MAKVHCNVGAAVSAVAKVTEINDIDWQIAGWGDCREVIANGVRREADRVARSFGFKDVRELANIAAERTSTRWVYFNFPCDTCSSEDVSNA
jgi:hypothetical protein